MGRGTVLESFEVGDLVQYTSYYDDPIGPWKMLGDLGIIISIRYIEDRYQVIKVRWFSDNTEIDMSPECLIRVKDLDLDKDT
tara:strand:- start:290 stop:535 length:246 start_codon:yes stop_codon:yes gene_type:complete